MTFDRDGFTRGFDVSRETMAALDRFVDLLTKENEAQNLVSSSTLPMMWTRHILDSAQLLKFAPHEGSWIDFGTGAGFPGLVVAALRSSQRTILVEERKLRADFLRKAVSAMEIDGRCEIWEAKVERLEPCKFDIISARAFAPLGKLLDLGERFATENTRWVLPKGRNAQTELDAVRSSWQGIFRLEPSMTDAEARIIVAEQVRRRKKGQR